MARTLITPQRATSAGLEAVYEPANVDGNSYRMVTGRVLHVVNGSGADITVTIPTPASVDTLVDGLAVPSRTITVTAGEGRFIALGNSSVYRQTGGVAHVDYSAVTTVTVAVIDVP